MSVNHITFGAPGWNWRWTRSSTTLTPGTRIVVRQRFFGTKPEIPAWRIRRATRFFPTLTSCAIRSSAWIRRAP